MKGIIYVIAIILAIDFLGFVAWVVAGQTPVGDVYVGTITVHVLRFVLSILGII